MKQFNKTLFAAVLLAGAGSANASIAYNTGGMNEAFLSAYDSTTGKTFAFDTGVTYNELVANVNNSTYTLGWDFSTLSTTSSNWSSFLTGANTNTIQYVVAVGNSTNFGAAITGAPLFPSVSPRFGQSAPAAIQGHALQINTNDPIVDNTQNISHLTLDTDAAGTGQHGLASTLWSGWIQNPNANYNSATGFQLGTLNLQTGANVYTTFAQEWKLSGNTLAFAAPVPLPAAVWMFGAGLMGMLRLNRRKSMAV